MFSKLFKRKAAPERKLTHANQLQVGDMLQLIDSFALPAQVKDQTFHVIAICSYQYQHQMSYEYELRSDSGHNIFMSLENENGEEWVNFSRKLSRNQVAELFDLDQFAEVFDSEELTCIDRQQEPSKLERWTAEQYQQTAQPSIAYYYEQDLRGKTASRYVEDGGEQCEVINLESDNGKHSIDIEIWQDGETDVFITISRPLTDIVDLYPGK